MPLRISSEEQRVALAQATIACDLNELQVKHDLTTWEMVNAITLWLATASKYAIRAERNSDD